MNEGRRGAPAPIVANGGDITVRLFGGLAVQRASTEVELGPRMQQLVLLDLVLNANSVVPSEALIDHLWGDDPPRSARTTLRAYVSNLRRLLPDDLALSLATRRGGYSAVIDVDAIDIVRFERLVEAAHGTPDPADRLAQLDHALTLATGPVLPDLGHEELAIGTVRRIDALVLGARAARAESLTELGRAHDAVAELDALVRGNPIDERLRGLQMLALYRAGRQSDALRAYELARTTLVDELGIDPSPELRDLERRILEHDPSLDAPAPTAAAPAGTGPTQAGPTPVAPAAIAPEPSRIGSADLPVVSDLVGRDVEFSLAASRFAEANAGRGQVFIVDGPAGIGKSTLVNEFARRARAMANAEWRVLWGQCIEADEVPSLWPIAQIIDTIGATEHPALAPFLPGSGAAPGDGDLFHFHREFVSLLGKHAATTPAVVLVEDVHVADARTVGLLQHVAASIRDQSIVLIVTTRPEIPDATAAALTELGRLPHTTRFSLAPLDVDAVLTLLNRHHGFDVDRAGAARLIERTGGNALFVTQLVNAHGAGCVDPELPLPDDVAGAISASLATLPADMIEVLTVSSFTGGTIAPEVDAVVLERDVDDIVDIMERGVEAGVIEPDPLDPMNYRFRHALIKEVLYGSVGRRRAAQLHGRIGHAVLADAGPEATRFAGDLARHFVLGARAGTATEAITWSRHAAEAATARTDFPEALRHWRRVVELLATLPDTDELALGLAQRDLGVAARYSAEVPEARTALLEALRLARSCGDIRLLGTTALELCEGTGYLRLKYWWNPRELGVDALTEALDAIDRLRAGSWPDEQDLGGDELDDLEARLLGQRAADGYARPYDQRLADLARGRSLVHSPRFSSRLDVLEWLVGWGAVPPAEQLAHADAAIERAQAAGALEAELLLRRYSMWSALEAGDADGVAGRLDAARRRVAMAGVSPVLDGTRLFGPAWDVVRGRLDAADDALVHDIEEFAALGPFAYENQAIARLTVLWLRGDVEPQIDGLIARSKAAQQSPMAMIATCFLAEFGELERARAVLEQFEPAHLLDADSPIYTALSQTFYLGTVAILGMPDEVREAYDLVLPLAGRLLGPGPGVMFQGTVDHFLAAGAIALGLFDDAEAHLARGVAHMRSLGAEPFLQRLRLIESDLAAARGDIDRARSVLDDVSHLAAGAGYKAVSMAAEHRLARLEFGDG